MIVQYSNFVGIGLESRPLIRNIQIPPLLRDPAKLVARGKVRGLDAHVDLVDGALEDELRHVGQRSERRAGLVDRAGDALLRVLRILRFR